MTDALRAAIAEPGAAVTGAEAVAPRRAAQAFEALLLAQILERAQEPLFGDGLLSGGSSGSLYRSWLAREIGEQMAARGGFGLAREIEAQMSRDADGEQGKEER